MADTESNILTNQIALMSRLGCPPLRSLCLTSVSIHPAACPLSGRASRAAHAIEAGWVQVNQGLGQSPGHSYGGYKESGIGREFSLDGMLESNTQRKNVTVNLTH